MSDQHKKWPSRIVGSSNVDPRELENNHSNFRTHPPAQRQALKGALDRLGYIQQVVVNKTTNRIVDGHLRASLAIEEGIEQIPVLYVELSESEEKLALLTFDPISAMAESDKDQLAALLGQVERNDPNLTALLDRLAKEAKGLTEAQTAGATDPDDVPPVPNRARSRLGDLYRMGKHRLVVGDATDRATLEMAVGGGMADLLWSDPPYGVAVEGKAGKILNDDLAAGPFQAFLDAAFGAAAAVLRPGGGFYIAHGDSARVAFQTALEKHGLMVKQCLIWVKNTAVLSRQDYNWRHEPLLVGWKEGAAHYFAFDYTETTVRDDALDLAKLKRPELEAFVKLLLRQRTTAQAYDRPAKSELHPTMKPVALVEQHLANSSRRGERVLDPFGGSGTTLIAAERLGRSASLVELDPKFADVIVKRWESFTGNKATLERRPNKRVSSKRHAEA